jgi:hypothetical protein
LSADHARSGFDSADIVLRSKRRRCRRLLKEACVSRLRPAFLDATRSALFVLFVAVLSISMFPAFADDVIDVTPTEKWPTAENRAFDASREAAAMSYITCLRETLRDDANLSALGAQSKCAEPAKQYAAFLPVERADQILESTAYAAKAHP